jgi:hypothetical protein
VHAGVAGVPDAHSPKVINEQAAGRLKCRQQQRVYTYRLNRIHVRLKGLGLACFSLRKKQGSQSLMFIKEPNNLCTCAAVGFLT